MPQIKRRPIRVFAHAPRLSQCAFALRVPSLTAVGDGGGFSMVGFSLSSPAVYHRARKRPPFPQELVPPGRPHPPCGHLLPFPWAKDSFPRASRRRRGNGRSGPRFPSSRPIISGRFFIRALRGSTPPKMGRGTLLASDPHEQYSRRLRPRNAAGA